MGGKGGQMIEVKPLEFSANPSLEGRGHSENPFSFERRVFLKDKQANELKGLHREVWRMLHKDNLNIDSRKVLELCRETDQVGGRDKVLVGVVEYLTRFRKSTTKADVEEWKLLGKMIKEVPDLAGIEAMSSTPSSEHTVLLDDGLPFAVGRHIGQRLREVSEGGRVLSSNELQVLQEQWKIVHQIFDNPETKATLENYRVASDQPTQNLLESFRTMQDQLTKLGVIEVKQSKADNGQGLESLVEVSQVGGVTETASIGLQPQSGMEGTSAPSNGDEVDSKSLANPDNMEPKEGDVDKVEWPGVEWDKVSWESLVGVGEMSKGEVGWLKTWVARTTGATDYLNKAIGLLRKASALSEKKFLNNGRSYPMDTRWVDILYPGVNNNLLDVTRRQTDVKSVNALELAQVKLFNALVEAKAQRLADNPDNENLLTGWLE